MQYVNGQDGLGTTTAYIPKTGGHTARDPDYTSVHPCTADRAALVQVWLLPAANLSVWIGGLGAPAWGGCGGGPQKAARA